MPVSDLHRRVAAIALRAAAGHGFALGGGNALLAHGVISRPTQDVDLFTDQEHGVEAASSGVEAALRDAGFQAQRRDLTAGLADAFPGMGEGLAEWIVTAADGEQMMLQMAYFDRGREPVVMDIGPVLDLEDVAGGKVCALAGRVEPRDYADTAAMLEHYSPAQLIGFARRLDSGLGGRDFADAGHRLDRLPDHAFATIGLSQKDISALRHSFASWPMTAEAVERELAAGSPGPGPRAQRPMRADHDANQDGATEDSRHHALIDDDAAERFLADDPEPGLP
jgi:Nucleotidyl transferase AbiEii toxin, Type IV TA system